MDDKFAVVAEKQHDGRWARRSPNSCGKRSESPEQSRRGTAGHGGNLEARHAVRTAAQHIGTAVATLVSLYNPSHVVVGGIFGHLSADMLTDIRSAVYNYAQPLATHTLKIEPNLLGYQSGTIGAAVMASQYLFSPGGIKGLLHPQPTHR